MNFIETAYAAIEENAAPAAEHTTTESANGGVLASLGINGTLLAAQFVNFTLVVLVLWFLILKPLTKKMSERQQIINDSLDNAKKVEENLKKSEADYLAKMNEAKAEATKVIEKSVTDAEAAALTVKNKAKQEIEDLISQAKRNIKTERDEMKQEIKKETAEMIITALEKILSEKITDKKDKELIGEMVKKLQ